MSDKKQLHQIDQYNKFPYPPEDSTKSIDENLLSAHNGVRKLLKTVGKIKNFEDSRILIAGCGTGNDLVLVYNALKEYSCKIVAIDLSENSIEICKRRLKRLGFHDINIEFHVTSIYDIPKFEFEKFDIISCRNVLHHLPDYFEGFKILNSVLHDDGCMMIELYGKYGRESTGTAQARKLMQLINEEITDWETKLSNAKIVLNNLPTTNLFNQKRNKLADAFTMGDAGIVDHLLNPIEKCFSVPEIYDLLDRTNLKLVSWFGRYHSIYNKKMFSGLQVKNLNKRTQQAINEMLFGVICQHTFMVKKI